MTKVAYNIAGSQFALAVGAAAVQLTLPATATGAVIDNSGGGVIRYTTDGSTPSATNGNRLAAGGTLNWNDPNTDYRALLAALKMIRESSSTTVEVQYYTYSG